MTPRLNQNCFPTPMAPPAQIVGAFEAVVVSVIVFFFKEKP